MPFGWSNYSYHPLAPGYSYYEQIPEYEYKEEICVERFEPALNLQANEPTLNCLKWLLVDQKDVDLEVSLPELSPINHILISILLRQNPHRTSKKSSTRPVTRTHGPQIPN